MNVQHKNSYHQSLKSYEPQLIANNSSLVISKKDYEEEKNGSNWYEFKEHVNQLEKGVDHRSGSPISHTSNVTRSNSKINEFAD